MSGHLVRLLFWFRFDDSLKDTKNGAPVKLKSVPVLKRARFFELEVGFSRFSCKSEKLSCTLARL
jgi:hypothetical protein